VAQGVTLPLTRSVRAAGQRGTLPSRDAASPSMPSFSSAKMSRRPPGFADAFIFAPIAHSFPAIRP
jgi:hypothetical protein